jgi:enamine deaminase RidA (YjgF/YER057c/UK114 family)
MNFEFFDSGSIPASVKISLFHGQNGVSEYHLMVHPTENGSFETQLSSIYHAYRDAIMTIGLPMGTVLIRRFFCSDLVNQAEALKKTRFAYPRSNENPCAVSWVNQPPAGGAKVSMWAYHVKDPAGILNKSQDHRSVICKRNGLTHFWTAGITSANGNSSYAQTKDILEQYEAFLTKHGMSLANNVMRTWFFVPDIDTNYQGLVDARKEFFAMRGLTKDTHFIASTGIEGTSADVKPKVTMDAHAIAGVRPEQIRYLAAPDHLSPTHIYGVTFERGVSIAYRDRTHIIISGTASIDRDGNIVHVGDVSRQLDRTIENVEALLVRAGGTLRDIGMLIAYVRDPSDQIVVRNKMQMQFGNVPMVVVVAPVCRPGWLVEIEAKAIIVASNSQLPLF